MGIAGTTLILHLCRRVFAPMLFRSVAEKTKPEFRPYTLAIRPDFGLYPDSSEIGASAVADMISRKSTHCRNKKQMIRVSSEMQIL
jgi:hypothetical protein